MRIHHARLFGQLGEPDQAWIWARCRLMPGPVRGGVVAGWVTVTALALAAGAWGIRELRRRFLVVTVAGESMWPAFTDGDRVLVRPAQLSGLRQGQVVVVEKPANDGQWTTPPVRWPADARNWIVKRVGALPGDPCPDVPAPALPFPSKLADLAGQPVPPGHLVVLGDNPGGSFDSRAFGYCPADRVLGVVIRPLSTRK